MPDVKMITVESDGTVSVGIDLAAPELTGFDALFQRTILTLMKTAGSDVQDDDDGDGGGLQGLFLYGSSGDQQEITAEAASIVRRTRRSMSIQQDRANLPPAERMKELQIVGSLSLRIRLVSGTNETANRTVVVG
jgi:hypothetical protein